MEGMTAEQMMRRENIIGDDGREQAAADILASAEITPLVPRYAWWGWQDETDNDNDNDRENVEYLTIVEDGEEMAVIIHRRWGDERDVPAKLEKEATAQRIVDALNRAGK